MVAYLSRISCWRADHEILMHDREAHVYMRRHQDAKVKQSDVSNVIYHNFLHGDVSYTLNGENVNVMLELWLFSLYINKEIGKIVVKC